MGVVNRDGALYMASGIDNSGLKKDAAEAEKIIEDFGKTVEDVGEKMSMSYDEAISKSKELQSQIDAQKKKVSLLGEAQLNAFNKMGAAEFGFDLDGTMLDEVTGKQIQVTKEMVETFKSEFESLDSTYRSHRAELESLENEYKRVLEVIAKQTKESTTSVKKDIENAVAPDAVRVKTSEIAKSLSELDKRFSNLKQNTGIITEKDIQTQREYYAELDKIHKELDALSKYSGVEASNNTEFNKQHEVSAKLLKEVRAELGAVGKSIKDNTEKNQKQLTIMTEMRNIRNEMGKLLNPDGTVSPENLQRYEELKVKLKEVGTAYRVVQQEQKNLTTAGSAQLAGLVNGITGLSGAFAAGQGVMSLFVKDNEQLAAIQTKLQAAMSITIGLQSAANALSATSTFRINTVTKAKLLWTNATKVLNTQLGISAGLTSALATGGIMLLVISIGYLIAKHKEWKKNQEEIIRLNKIVTDSLKNAALEGKKSAQQELTNLKLLYSASQNEIKSKEERLKAIQEMQKQYPSYFGNLSKEEILAGKGADAYNRLSNSIIKAAKARAAADKITENQSKKIDLETKRAEALSKIEKAETALKKVDNADTSYGGGAAMATYIQTKRDEIAELRAEIWETTLEIGKLDEANRKLADTINIQDLAGKDNFIKGSKEYWSNIRDEQQRIMDANLPASDIFKAAKKQRDEAAKMLEQWDKAKDKGSNKDNSIIDQKDKIKQLLDKQARDRARIEVDLANQVEQASIDAEENLFVKKTRQRELNNKLEIQALQRQKEDYIAAFIQAEKEKFDAEEDLRAKQNKSYIKKTFGSSTIKVDVSFFDKIIQDISKKQEGAILDNIDKSWNEYFIKFGNYQEKRLAITQKYEKLISEAMSGGERASLSKEMANELDDLDNSIKGSTTLMAQLFADTSQKSVNEIQLIIDKVKLLLQYLKVVKDEDGNAVINGKTVTKKEILDLGISPNTLDNLENSTEAVESLSNGLNNLKGTLGSRSPFKMLESQIKESIEQIGKGGKNNIGLGIQNISNAIMGALPAVQSFGNDLANILGDDKLAEDIGLATEAIGGIGSAAAGVGRIMSGDVVGGIQGVVSGLSSVVTVWGKIKDRRKEKEIQRLQEQIEVLGKAYEKLGRSIDKAYSKDAAKLIKQQDEALKKQQILIRQQIREEEGKKKKNKGRINDWKNELEEIDRVLEENKDKAIDVIFGQDIKSAIDDFANAYAEAWAAGEDRAQASKDFVKNMIKKMIIEAMKMDISAPMQKIRDKLNAFWSDGFISINEEAMINAMVEDLQKELDQKYAWADKYLKDSDIDDRSSEAKGFAQASQDSVDQLIGLANVSVEHSRWILEKNSSMEEHLREMKTDYRAAQNTINSILSHTRNIDLSTSGIHELIGKMRSDINSLVTKGITLKK